MSKQERAEISRKNGAKSKGPKTEEGKAKSSRNGIKSGDFAKELALFVAPDSAVLCNEERQAFYELLDGVIETYQPANPEALAIVRQLAVTRWQINRLNSCITMHWNFALLDAGAQPASVVPELASVQAIARASHAVNAGDAIAERVNRQIDRLEMRISRLRRDLRAVNALAPVELAPAEKRTQPAAGPNEENKPLTPENPEKSQSSEPPIYTTERDPLVLAAYRLEFPGRRIIVLPPDDVANGIEVKDDMPIAPRRST